MSLSHLFEKMKFWNPDLIGYSINGAGAKLKRTWNLAPVLQIVQKIDENCCLC